MSFILPSDFFSFFTIFFFSRLSLLLIFVSDFFSFFDFVSFFDFFSADFFSSFCDFSVLSSFPFTSFSDCFFDFVGSCFSFVSFVFICIFVSSSAAFVLTVSFLFLEPFSDFLIPLTFPFCCDCFLVFALCESVTCVPPFFCFEELAKCDVLNGDTLPSPLSMNSVNKRPRQSNVTCLISLRLQIGVCTQCGTS